MVRSASRIILLFASSAALAEPAIAQQTFLDGAYGNKDGCAYANTNESIGSEDFFLLTDEGITSAASYCGFKGPMTKKGDSFSASVTCAEEGESDEADDSVDILRTGKDYTIVFKDGMRWGPLKKCK